MKPFMIVCLLAAGALSLAPSLTSGLMPGSLPGAPVGAGSPTGSAAAFDPAWSANPIWNDGLAEVAHYAARRTQYEKPRTFEQVLITVAEDFNRAFFAKAEPPYQGKNLLPVLKLNVVAKYDTENYPYSYLASVFVDRKDPTAAVKLTVSSQEWCGNTFKELKTWGGRTELIYHSYWDEEGDGSKALDWRPGDFTEDQLPLSLRGLRFAPGLEVKIRLLPSQLSNRARGIELIPATIRVEGREPAGVTAAWKVRLSAGKLEQTYWMEAAAPHILVKMVSNDGREMLLKKRSRRAYWNR